MALYVNWVTHPALSLHNRAMPHASELCTAIEDAERGRVDADLGGGLIKQRVARKGQGKSSGYRMLIGFRSKLRAVFLFGFAKSELDNIDDDQLATLREIV
jgi:hypothetical protein